VHLSRQEYITKRREEMKEREGGFLFIMHLDRMSITFKHSTLSNITDRVFFPLLTAFSSSCCAFIQAAIHNKKTGRNEGTGRWFSIHNASRQDVNNI
jgi:hypothetical protein